MVVELRNVPQKNEFIIHAVGIEGAETAELPKYTVVDISDWRDISPAELLRTPSLFPEVLDQIAAARALKYARSGETQSYDEIGFRASAAVPEKGFAPLTTLAQMEMERSNKRTAPRDPLIDELVSQEMFLEHRPIDLPQTDEREFRYETKADLPSIPAQGMSGFQVPGGCWIPLTVLVEAGGFRPFQEWQNKLTQQTLPGNFYFFLSHRWDAQHHPDPNGIKAATIAWQMFYLLCNAVRIAATRGLWEPRLVNRRANCAIGLFGSDITESLPVNVLRAVGHETFLNNLHENQERKSVQAGYTIISNLGDLLLQKELMEPADENWIKQAFSEAEAIQPLTEETAASAALNDLTLQRLDLILQNSPTLRTLMSRIQCWYDFSCLPQAPRTDAEEILFNTALTQLLAIQLVGRTIALIDNVETYLSRAWCTLELLAGNGQGRNGRNINLIGVPPFRLMDRDFIERTFLWDRRHIVWRALVDTEVFGVQSFSECMNRLRLNVSVADDVPYIYSRLVELGVPETLQHDPSEIVTGVFPLPVTDGADSFVWTNKWPTQSFAKTPANLCFSLSLEPAFKFDQWNASEVDRKRNLPPFTRLHPHPSNCVGRHEKPSCHVAVVGCCEGEALMLANWVHDNVGQIEAILGTRVVSHSWLSVDAAPVGHFQNGRLHAFPVQADTWIVVALSLRFEMCKTTRLMCSLAMRQTRAIACVSFDEAAGNVVLHEDAAQHKFDQKNGWLASLKRFVASAWTGLGFKRSHVSPEGEQVSGGLHLIQCKEFPIHFGGLYRGSLLKYLLTLSRVDIAARNSDAMPTKNPESDSRVANTSTESSRTTPSMSNSFEIFNLLVDEKRRAENETWHALCYLHLSTIIEHFSEWKSHVACLRGDQAARSNGAQTLCAISRTLGLAGNPEIVNALVQDDDVVLTEAYRVYEAGMYADCVAMLLPIIAGLEAVGGTTADEWLGKMLGMAGNCCLWNREWANANEYTQRALKECERTQDEVGKSLYRANLRIIRCAVEPSSTAAICRRLIAQAQQLSDSGWLEKSNAILVEVLGKLETTSELDEYRPKVFGLLGMNFFRINDLQQAWHFTSLAIPESVRQGDAKATMIYTANLDVITQIAKL